MKRLICGILTVVMLLSLVAVPVGAVSEDSVIQTVGLLGILNGNTSGDLGLGRNVTRAEFTKMVIAASSMRELTSASSANAPFPDVRSNHWAAGYVSAAVASGWVNGYLDGRFRPDNPVKMEEAVNIVLKLLGFSAADFSGAYPDAQINKYHALKLDENVGARKGEYMTRRACMYLLYNALNATNKEGRVHCTTLGYAVGSDGKIDTVNLLDDTVEGPIIVQGATWNDGLPFSADTATVYKNDAKTTAAAIAADDVVYYSSQLRTLWVYSQKVHGTLESASPNLIAPTSVTVSGKSYQLSSAGSYALSNIGGYKIGDTVTLLLGKDGDVVGAASTGVTTGEVYGVVVEISTKQYNTSSGDSYSANVVKVLDTTGMTGEYQYQAKSLKVGDVVRVSVGSTVKIYSLGTRRLTGKINGTGVGTTAFAQDVEILDVCEGRGMKIYPTRLAGMTLATTDVMYYVTNAEGEITHLILDDFTGDLKQYGIITDIQTSGNEMTLNKSYTCIVDGKKTTISNASADMEITTGGFSMMTTLSGKTKLTNLKHVALRALNEKSAQGGSVNYRVSEKVVVYEYRDGEYFLSSIGAVSEQNLSFVGYYDSDGWIRVVLAK